MDPSPTATEQRADPLVPPARLFGRLLIREIDAEMLARLRAGELGAAMAQLGIRLPKDEDAKLLEDLAAEYFDCFLGPEQPGPLVQSLWQHGTFEREPAAAIRALAETAGLSFEKTQARGAPVDHLGSLLLLWADFRERWPSGASHLAEHHLRWAAEPLRRVAGRGSFYGQLCDATRDLIEQIRHTSGAAGTLHKRMTAQSE